MMNRNEQAKMNRGSLLFLITSGVFVSVAVAFGLWITPSPSAQREIELDKQRVDDLIAIADAVLSYQRAKGKFPIALSAVPESATLHLADRQTSAAYGYSLNGSREFKVCADFTTVSDKAVKSSPPEASGWKHQTGRLNLSRSRNFFPVHSHS
jgi:hypothetical protein